jgi:hypothetical protein
MFIAYIDDSGTDPQQQVANASVLIIPAARTVALESEWNRLKRKEHFSCWHTSEAVARNKESDFANWDDAKFERVFHHVRQICKKYCVQPMSFSVYKRDYDDVVLPHLPYADKHHYTWAIRMLLSYMERWRSFKNVPPLEYVFSWMGEKRRNTRRQEIEDVMDQAEEDAREKGTPGEFEHWTFRPPKEIPGLQCVDAFAWCIYQCGLQAFCKKPMSKAALTTWEDFGDCVGGRFDVTVKREHLKTWVDKELADGRSAKRLQEWKERKRRPVTKQRQRPRSTMRPLSQGTK